MTKMLSSAAKECVIFFYELSFLHIVSVSYANFYGKLVSYLPDTSTK